MKKIFFIIALSLSTTVFASDVSINVGHSGAPNGFADIASNEFKRLVEKRSNGRIKVSVYPSGQLGGERELVEAAQLGTVDMAVVLAGILESFEPKWITIFTFGTFFKHFIPFSRTTTFLFCISYVLCYLSCNVLCWSLTRTSASHKLENIHSLTWSFCGVTLTPSSPMMILSPFFTSRTGTHCALFDFTTMHLSIIMLST